MLIFTDRKLAFLATPKTGSTSVEMALRGKADVIFRGRRKHVNAIKFRRQVAPFLAKGFGVELRSVALMRHPVDQLRSWYKYRARPLKKGQPISTHGMSFDSFMEALISENPPPFARVGSQTGFLLLKDGSLGVDALFQYERMERFLDFLSAEFGEEITLGEKNVSPPIDAPLSEEMEAALREARPAEFELYDRLEAAGGLLERVEPQG